MTSRAQAEGLLALTTAIGHAAQQADWPEAARLTEQRAPLLISLTSDIDDETLKIVRNIQAIDAAVFAMAANNKEKLEASYNEAMRSASAMKEYHRVAML
ncbi:flagellar protein FliT [Paraburkholderia fungorum]|uniref:flagellar protein FliT n=1 Tax=Paraburkholderia fungorum TaxID=134537 RepID=UPI0038B8EAD4